MKNLTQSLRLLIGVLVVACGLTINGGTSAVFAQSALDGFDPNANGTVRAVVVQADGKILIGGDFTSVLGTPRNRVARLNPDGTLDDDFDPNADGDVRTIVVQADSKILIGGDFTSVLGTPRNRVARLNSDGTLDAAFDPNVNGGVYAMAVQADEQILVGGFFNFVTPNGGAVLVRNNIARLNADGTLDTAFDPNADGQVLKVVVQADGKILLGGEFTTLSPNGGAPVTRNNIARLNADGTLDAAFDPNASSAVYGMAVQADGRILVGGFFTSIGGAARNSFARLTNNTAALQNLSATRTRITWTRGGGGTELDHVIFESSTDNRNFTALGVGTRIGSTSSWTLGGLALASNQNLYLRARGFTLGGYGTSSSGTVETVRNVFFTARQTQFDFDGDGRADLGFFRDGNWYVSRSSTNQYFGAPWGLNTDRLAPADYDGDGKTDIAVWRDEAADPDRAVFYIVNSGDNSVRVEQFGRTGDLPLPGDWDGDGKVDLAVYRAGTNGGASYFFYRPSSQPGADFTTLYFGQDGDKAVKGDFDGDGRLDAAVFRPSNGVWYIQESGSGAVRYEYWGLGTDKLVPADYDGDGKTDVAVLRDGVWYIKESRTNQPRYEYFGLASDVAVPADYDGDGRDDVAVFRDGTWYALQSADKSVNNGFQASQFGQSGDVAVESAYLP